MIEKDRGPANNEGPSFLISMTKGEVLFVVDYKPLLAIDVIQSDDVTTLILTADLTKRCLSNLDAKLLSFPPGTRTLPVAHSHSDVFAYCVAGTGLCWYNGTTHSFSQNDCVGLRAGDGDTFAFLNDGDTEQNLDILLMTIEDKEDSLFYPFTPVGLMLVHAT